MTQVQESIQRFCEKCPANNNEDCGPWQEDDSKIFQSCKQIHQNHPGWQLGEPKKDSFDQLVQDVTNAALKAEKAKEEISSLPQDGYQVKLRHELDHLKEVIERDFPNRSFAIEVALSVKAQMKIEGITQVFPLILMGKPSSYKSTILEIISVLPDCYVSDSFTPKSFVSHSANSKKEDLGKVDLLPRIKHKTLITPELAPLFSGNQDELIEKVSILTRILDGRGFVSDSGVHGRRGYTGDYSFMWLGAIVDIPHRVWKLLGNLGPRIYFVRLPEDAKSINNKLDEIKKNLKEDSYTARLASSKMVIKRYWNLIECRPKEDGEKIIWDKENDNEDALNKIIELAMLLSNLRATVPTWHTYESDSGGSNYNFETPVKEEPSRASNALYNLARGHALLYGRNYITTDELSIVIPVALSSAPKERVDLFRLLIKNDGKLNTDQSKDLAKVSRATALKEMSKLKVLGLVDEHEEESTTKPIKVINLKTEYNWFLSPEFKVYLDKFEIPYTPTNSKLTSSDNLEKKGVSKAQKASVGTASESNTLEESQA